MCVDLGGAHIPVRNSLRRAPWSIPFSPMKETLRRFFGEACFCLAHCFSPLWNRSSLVTLMLNDRDVSTFFSSDIRMSDTLHNNIKRILLRIQCYRPRQASLSNPIKKLFYSIPAEVLIGVLTNICISLICVAVKINNNKKFHKQVTLIHHLSKFFNKRGDDEGTLQWD